VVETIADYSGYDFQGQWKGREKVTEVERSLLELALARADTRRVLEVGSGFGRLLEVLLARGGEVVATDFDCEALQLLRVPDESASRVRRIGANVYHLPFADRSFTTVSMIRVFHHLADPVAALKELARVLAPGGTLAVSYNPRRTVGSLIMGLKGALHTPPGDPPADRAPQSTTRLEVTVDPFPVFVAPREVFSSDARAAGFRPTGEYVSGMEEFAGLRWLPARLFIRIGEVFRTAPGFPARLAVLSTTGEPGGAIPERLAILQCPRCRHPLEAPILAGGAVRCEACAFEGGTREGVLDLRYTPDGSVRIGPAVHGS
jgi:SAM-dependent methyltransferase